jgi:small subunit ribosomal protein S4
LLNGHKINIPSAHVKPGDIIAVKPKSREVAQLKEAVETIGRRQIPSWLEIDAAAFSGAVKALPAREELTVPMQEQLIVELYSR